MIRIALVGDYHPDVPAHRAIPLALAVEGVAAEWRHTATLDTVEGYHGVWCVPASPYANESAAIGAIRHARTRGVPFLGTCGGFQHAVLEFARNVLGWSDAAHEETAGESGGRLVVRRLSCSLVEVEDSVQFVPGSRLHRIHNGAPLTAGYHCNFGMDPAVTAALDSAGLRVTAHDAAGEPRAVELDGHPFYIGTLFQPERAALKGVPVPIVRAFVRACEEFASASA